MSHRSDADVMRRFSRIAAEVGTSAARYLLLDARTPGIAERWAAFIADCDLGPVEIVTFDIVAAADQLRINLMRAGSMIPGSCHFPLLFLGEQASHDHYWLVEDDVMLTGDWGDLIRTAQGSSADLLCSHLATFPELPNWYWWPSLHVPVPALHQCPPASFVMKGYFPVYRISRAALHCVLAAHRSGWSGHCEAIIPSALRHAGLAVADLNSLGGQPLYTPGALFEGEGPSRLSTMRWRPLVEPDEMRAVTGPHLFHPVK